MSTTTTAELNTPGGFREMLAISTPMVVSHACETLLIFIDRLFLSRIGPEPMNAAMAGGLSSFMLMTFFVGLIGYTTALVAQYLGAGRKSQCTVVVTQAMLLVLPATLLVFACRPLVYSLFGLMDIPAVQREQQQLYFDILLYGTPLVLLRTSLSGFFSGIGRTRIVMISAMVAMVVNAVANYVLIFGHLGFPALGLRGAAYGTLFSSSCALLVLLTAYVRRTNRDEFTIGAGWLFHRTIMAKLLRYGSPAGVEMFLNLLAFTLIVLIFHSHGVVTATAVTIVFNWDLVSFVPLLGLQIGVVSLVGRYMGAGSPEVAERAAFSGLKMGWIYSSLVLLLFVTLPQQMVDIFAPSATNELFLAAAPLAVDMLRLAALYVLADATIVVFSGTLRGAGDTLWAMGLSVAMHWIMVPIVFVFLKVLNFSPIAVWLAFIVFFLISGGLFYLRFRHGHWKTLVVVKD
ncbi:MATE family efflux transporter [Pelovirga terrestris]|uniref:Multidrug-efflux transporter n=1 Tax=Pelovirga terrestris TaxID=2771352 RepID=A0A8J6UI84_9BACT|nr:MATE family efflux transporter [Pelovirga terrestris]